MPELSSRLALAVPDAYPVGARVNDAGHLEVAGCDVVELCREYGTPAYIFDEADMVGRAARYRDTAAQVRPVRPDGTAGAEILFASKALPCTAAYRLFASEGLSVDVASGGELHMALAAGFEPSRIYMHGNNKTDDEIRYANDSGVGLLIIDSFDEIDRLERLLDRPQRVLIRVTPGIEPTTHSYIRTGQIDSKFGFGIADGVAAGAIDRVLGSDRLELVGLHAHIGSQLFDLEPYRLEVEALAELAGPWCEVLDIGGGVGVVYTEDDHPPKIEDAVRFQLEAVAEHFGDEVRVMLEPGRSLVANAGLTAYTVGTRKEIPGVRTYIAVDGGMSDNLRPMLYGSKYHAVIANRAGANPEDVVTIAGMHCESGDIIARDAELASPQVGDILVTPATGAYGHAMASNYNGLRRPPIVFCRNGESRLVVRRETYDDLLARDV